MFSTAIPLRDCVSMSVHGNRSGSENGGVLSMKEETRLVPYVLFGLFITLVGIFLIPFADILGNPQTTYLDGLRNVFTYIIATTFGASFAYSLYLSER